MDFNSGVGALNAFGLNSGAHVCMCACACGSMLERERYEVNKCTPVRACPQMPASNASLIEILDNAGTFSGASS